MKKLLPFLLICGCSQSTTTDESIYTLYRNSPYLQESEGANLDPKWNRVHVASFDATGMDDDYNRSNCDRVKRFYDDEWQSYHDIKPEHWSHFWCEKGRFNPA